MAKKKKNKLRYAQRQENKMSVAALLRRSGFGFSVHNDGSHLIMKANGELFDLWPTTDKWMSKDKGPWKAHVGISDLIEKLRREQTTGRA